MGASRFSWDEIKSDYGAGQASALQASRMQYDMNGDRLSKVLNDYTNKEERLTTANNAAKSAGNTADIIEQIRAGKTPERTGLYDAGAISDAKYEYEKYQTAQAFKRRAEGRAIAAAGRARSGGGRGTGAGGSGTGVGAPGGYVPYGSTEVPAEKSILDAYLPVNKSAPFDNNMIGDLYEKGGMFEPDAGSFSVPSDMTVLDEMIADRNAPTPFSPTVDSADLWKAANPNPGTSEYAKAVELAETEKYLDANNGMALPVRDRTGRPAIDPNAENARWNMIDKDMNSEWSNEWKAKDARAGYYTDEKNDNNIVNGPYGSGSGDFREYPSAPVDSMDVARQKLIQAMNSETVAPVDPNAENAAIQEELLLRKAAEQRALSRAASIKAGLRTNTPDYPETSRVTTDSLITDNSDIPGSNIDKEIEKNRAIEAEKQDTLSRKIKEKEEAASLKAFKTARTEDAKALKAQDAAIDKRVADEKAEVAKVEAEKVLKAEAVKTEKKNVEIDRLAKLTPEEAGREVYDNWAKGDMKNRDADAAIKKYYESKGITVDDKFIAKTAKYVKPTTPKPAVKKTPVKTPVKKAGSVMTTSQLKGRHAKESIKHTKVKNDIVNKAEKEKLAITKWAANQTNKVSRSLSATSRDGKSVFKATEGQIKRDAKKETAEQDAIIAEAKANFNASVTENNNALEVGKSVIEEAKVAREKKEQPAKDALKAATKLKNELRSANTKEKKKFADFKAVQKKLNPSVTENMVLARYNGLNLDGSKYQAPKKESKADRTAKHGKVKTDAILSSIYKQTGIKASQLDKAKGSSGSYQKLNELRSYVNSKYPEVQTSDVVAFLMGSSEDKVLDLQDQWRPLFLGGTKSTNINYTSARIIEMFDNYAKKKGLKEGDDSYTPKGIKKIVDKNADAIKALKPNN